MKIFVHLLISNFKYNRIELGISYFITSVILVLFNVFRDPKSSDNDFLFSIAFYAMLYAFYTNRRKFNLKYLLSLPLSKSQLIMAKTSSDFVYFVPAILLAFTGVIFSKHEFSAFPLLVLLFQAVMFVAFIIFDSDIEQPRLENAKSSFLNRLIYVRKGMDFLFFGVFIVYLAIAINLIPVEMSLKQYLLIIFVSVALNYKFNRTLSLLKDESYSYFIPKRDLMTIGKKISIFGIIGILFMLTGLTLPTKYGKDKIYSLIKGKNDQALKKALSELKQMKKSSKGYTPLTAIISEGRVDGLKYLESLGFGVNKETLFKFENKSYDPISLAIVSDKLDMIKHLLENKGLDDERLTIGSKQKPLLEAAEACSPEIVDYFVSRNVDINHRDLEGNTALIISAKNGCSSVMSILLEAGANPLVKNEKDKIASTYIKSKKKKYLVKRKEKLFINKEIKQINREIASEK